MNDYREYSDYLMHYGVKGMKWHDHKYADPYVAKGFRSANVEQPTRSGFRSVAVSALRSRQQRQQAQDEQRRRQAQAHQQQLALNAQRQRAQANAPTNNTNTDDGHQNGSESREDFLSNLQSSLEGQANNLGDVGEALKEMIDNGNYWGAFGYYKSLDMETRDLLNKRIMNHELPEALGNGNIEEGKRRVEIGQKIANFLLSNPIHQYNSRTLGALTGGEIGTGKTSTIRRNEEAKDFHSIRRKRISHNDEYSDDIYHHGILGMHWGIRRYQNPDGTLTEAGKKRYDRLNAKAKLAEGFANDLADEYEAYKEGTYPKGKNSGKRSDEYRKYANDLKTKANKYGKPDDKISDKDRKFLDNVKKFYEDRGWNYDEETEKFLINEYIKTSDDLTKDPADNYYRNKRR